MTKTFLKPALLSIALLTGTGTVALASGGTVPQETRDQITATLTADGYEVRKIEMEDGQYEAYALKDGQRFEIYFDANLKIVRTKTDD